MDDMPPAYDPALRIEGPAITVVGVIGLALLDLFGDAETTTAATMHVYRRLADRGLVCRQKTSAGQESDPHLRPPTPAPDEVTMPRRRGNATDL